MEQKKKIKILHTVSEVVPFVATGGMGQVAGALSKALAEYDEDLEVRVVAPLYSHFRDVYEPQMEFLGETEVRLAWRTMYCGVYSLEREGVTFYFVDNRHYFDREQVYGYYDDGERYAFFCKAVFAAIEVSGFVPDIIHAHDWQTALVPVYLKTRFSGLYGGIKSVFTIHNMEYQGKYSREILHDVFDLIDDEPEVIAWLMKNHGISPESIQTIYGKPSTGAPPRMPTPKTNQ